jgi:hypothetical protein
MSAGEAGKLALLWRGDHQERSAATAQNSRLNRVFEALARLGILVGQRPSRCGS